MFRQHLFGMGSALPEYLRALLPAPQERSDGSLVVWGYASRGECIYTYPSNEGVVRVYRPGSVVFDPASLESFRGAPVTHGHPPETDGYMVTPATWRAQAHGSVLEPGRAWYEHGLIAVPLTLQTQEIIDAFRAGRVALSTGELCIETPLSGQIDGQGYDRVLEAMLINHLALVDVGRAGPLAQIRAHQLPTLQPPTQRPERHMEYVKIVINGHEFWVPKNEQEAERARIERAFTERHNAALAPIQAERDRLQARADEQAAQIEQLRARPAEEELTARVNQAAAATIQERVEAMTRVLPLFGGQTTISRQNEAGQVTQVNLLSLPREELLREAIKTRRPNAQLEGKGLGYLEAYIEALLEHATASDASTQHLDRASASARHNAAQGTQGAPQSELDKARAESAARLESAWKGRKAG